MKFFRKEQVHTIEPVQYFSLISTLKAFWIVSYAAGLLPDWCVSVRRNSVSVMTNRLGCAFTLITIVLLLVYSSVQFVLQFRNMTSLSTIIFILTWLMDYILAAPCFLYYYFNRDKIIQFFSAWDRLEKNRLIAPYMAFTERNQSTATIVRAAAPALQAYSVVAVLALAFSNMNDVANETMISNWQPLRDTFTPVVLDAFQSWSTYIVLTLLNLSAFVPALFFYHAGIVVKAFNQAGRRLFDQRRCVVGGIEPIDAVLENRLSELWVLYEDVRRCVMKANLLFGFLTFCSTSYLFFQACFVSYSVLKFFDELSIVFLIHYISTVFLVIFMLILCTLWTAHLDENWHELAADFGLVLSRHNESLTAGERDRAKDLLNSIQTNRLASRPYNLFTIDRSLLLPMFSNLLTYVIIVIQIK